MRSDNFIIIKGTVTKANGNGIFVVRSDEDEKETQITCTISGKIRKNAIKIIEGDFVEIEISPYDLTRGRIVYRTKR